MDEDLVANVDLASLASFGLTMELFAAFFEEMGLEVQVENDKITFSDNPVAMLVEVKKKKIKITSEILTISSMNLLMFRR